MGVLASESNNEFPPNNESINSAEEFLKILKNPRPNGYLTSGSPKIPQSWITFNGSEDFSGLKLGGASIENWTGITAEQLLSTTCDFRGSRLPAVSFRGNEDLSGLNLQRCDISKLTGITAQQISAIPAGNLKSLKMSSEQFQAFRNVLKEKNITDVYVDGKYTKV